MKKPRTGLGNRRENRPRPDGHDGRNVQHKNEEREQNHAAPEATQANEQAYRKADEYGQHMGERLVEDLISYAKAELPTTGFDNAWRRAASSDPLPGVADYPVGIST